jgi:hypothetical protein
MTDDKRPRAKPHGEGYEIGYGKPPRNTRFKPGQSGNPKGRPKGLRNFATDLKAALSMPVELSRGDKRKKVSAQEAMLARLVQQALKGDYRAIALAANLAKALGVEVQPTAGGTSKEDEQLIQLFLQRVETGAIDRSPADMSSVTAEVSDQPPSITANRVRPKIVRRRSTRPPKVEGPEVAEEE